MLQPSARAPNGGLMKSRLWVAMCRRALGRLRCLLPVLLVLAAGYATLSPAVSWASLVSAVLPASRSVQVGDTATAFATIINTGSVTATGCDVSLPSPIAATFTYQTTDPATNLLTGTANTPADIPPGGSQSFVFAITPTAPIAPVDLDLLFGCSNTSPAPVFSGLNTLQFSAAATPVPDIVALSATLQGDGIVRVNGTGVFAVATVNLGASGEITVSADTGAVGLPVQMALCETDPATGVCLSAIGSTVTTTVNTDATPTFGVFITGSGEIAFDPVNHRINVRFHDETNRLVGATSVAVRSGGQAQVTVRAFLGDAETPAGAGVTISVGDTEQGVTGDDGTLTFTVEAGSVEVTALLPDLAGASYSLTLAPGAHESVDLVMESYGLQAETTLTVAEVRRRVLPMDFASFELKFVRSDGSPVSLTDLDAADIEDPLGGISTDLLPFLALQDDGRVIATDLEALRSTLLPELGEIEISAHAEGEDGRTHGGRTKLHLGRYTLTGALAAPPSNPDLPLAGVAVTLTFMSLGEDIVFQTSTDAAGAFTFDYVPFGPVQLGATIEDNGQFYNGLTAFSMDSDELVTLTMLTTQDVIDGVAGSTFRTPAEAAPPMLRSEGVATSAAANVQAAAAQCTTIDYYTSFTSGIDGNLEVFGSDPAFPLFSWTLADGARADRVTVIDGETSETLYDVEGIEGPLPGRIIRYGDYSIPGTRRHPFIDYEVAPPLETDHLYNVEIGAAGSIGSIEGIVIQGTKPCDSPIETDIPIPPGGIAVRATGGDRDQRVSDTWTLNVPAGTEVLTLSYAVSSGEYPTYVSQKDNPFDDIWEIKVSAPDGTLLFAQSVTVNSQLRGVPQWQEFGTTGLLTEELNVSRFTANDTQIVLSAASTNIGDGFLPTTIFASLAFDLQFNISGLTPDVARPIPASRNQSSPQVKITKGDSTYYSIPRMGEDNTFERSFTLKLTGRPQGVPISKVTAHVYQASRPSPANFVMLVDQAPDGKVVTEVDKNTLKVVVTTGNRTLSTDPPPWSKIQYRFTVELDLPAGPTGGNVVSKPKDSNPKTALWRMPDPCPDCERPGGRDPGHDDWAANGTYEWMQRRDVLAVLMPINDISGEHALNLGHDSHLRGTDIDMYHFTHLLTGKINGTENYRRLESLVLEALSCLDCPDVQQAITDWITTARNEIDKLTAMDTVARVIFAKGCTQTKDDDKKKRFQCSASALPVAWVKKLMKTGALNLDGLTLDLGIGAWSNGKVHYLADHNDHVHITLDATKLANQP